MMARKNTKPSRIDPELDKIIREVKAKNLIKGKNLSNSRITLAMARQYKKYPQLLRELLDAEIK